ncbi:MAG TPA: GNAT family N-acetyltransferase, partial [Treponemataceae bacterium]|nr:GNAT family N-acetyltransferase [Treponemataceae bacterium]
GAALSSPFPADSFLTAQLSLVYVFPEFRGMGIGKELLERTVRLWSDKGYRWLLCASPLVPSTFAPVLHRAGFEEKGHLSVLDLASRID